jgi:hypothetical protein
MKRRLILFGVAPPIFNVLDALEPNDEVVAICDFREDMAGRKVRDFEVEHANRLDRNDWDLVVVSSGAMSLYQFLREKHIPPERILYAKREIMRGDYSRRSLYRVLAVFLMLLVIASMVGTLI